MDKLRCPECLFCEGMEPDKDLIRCSNADVAQEAGWEELYFSQGFLDLPLPAPEDRPCFWYVPRR
ncbi:MAG: hypothetical protein C4525_12725 [Desulfarculus sp.]|jgi:hypothetical protein|nr:MAG: hypothetical protein C4525_12725 [Desulfarculus sp.]